jgi:hypothetical protein
MDEVQQRAGGVSYAPSPPGEFCGREEERGRLSKRCSKESPGFNPGRNCVSHPAFVGFGYTAE